MTRLEEITRARHFRLWRANQLICKNGWREMSCICRPEEGSSIPWNPLACFKNQKRGLMKDQIPVSCVQPLNLGILGLSEFWARFFLAGDELTGPFVPKCSFALWHLFGSSALGKISEFLLLWYFKRANEVPNPLLHIRALATVANARSSCTWRGLEALVLPWDCLPSLISPTPGPGFIVCWGSCFGYDFFSKYWKKAELSWLPWSLSMGACSGVMSFTSFFTVMKTILLCTVFSLWVCLLILPWS